MKNGVHRELMLLISFLFEEFVADPEDRFEMPASEEEKKAAKPTKKSRETPE